jgi:hypothetical protein
MKPCVPALVAATLGIAACGGGGGEVSDPRAKEKGQAEFEVVRAGFGVLETLAGAGVRQDDVNE